MEIMQGDSRLVYMDLKQDDKVLTPEEIVDLEVSVGRCLRKLFSKQEVTFDAEQSLWRFRLTQEETLALTVHEYDVIARAKYRDATDSDVLGIKIGTIKIVGAPSKAVL